MSILIFIPDFNKVEIAFYSVFDHRTGKILFESESGITSNFDFIEIRNKKQPPHIQNLIWNWPKFILRPDTYPYMELTVTLIGKLLQFIRFRPRWEMIVNRQTTFIQSHPYIRKMLWSYAFSWKIKYFPQLIDYFQS